MAIMARLQGSLASRGVLIALWSATAFACALWAAQTWRAARSEVSHHIEMQAHAALWPLAIAMEDAEARLAAPLTTKGGLFGGGAEEALSLEAAPERLRQPLAAALAASRDGRPSLAPVIRNGDRWSALMALPTPTSLSGAFRYAEIDGARLEAYWSELLAKHSGQITVRGRNGEIWTQISGAADAAADADANDGAIVSRLAGDHGVTVAFEHADVNPWGAWFANLPISLAMTGIMLLATMVLGARSLENARAHKRAVERARQSEDRLAAWTRAGADFFWETGVDYRFTEFRNITGTALDSAVAQALGMTRWETAGVSDPADHPGWAAHLADLEARRPFRGFQYYGIYGGEERWVSVSGMPYFDDAGNFLGYRGISTNVAAEESPDYALRRSQHEVAKSERLLRSVIEQLPATISIKDTDGRFLMYNCRFARMAGLEADEGVGKTTSEAMPTPVGQGIESRDLQVLTTKTPMRIERSDGEAVLDITKFPVLDEDGNATAIVSIGHDITEHRKAEQYLASSEKRLAQMVEMLPAGAVYVEDGRLMMNAAAEEITGRSRDELTSLDEWFERVPEAGPEQARLVYDAEAATGFARPRTFAIRRPDGGRRKVEWAGYRSGAREVWLIQDVTAREEADARFESLFEESAEGHVIMQDRRIVQSNLAAAKLMGGATKDFLVGMTLEELLPERQPDGRLSSEWVSKHGDVLVAQNTNRFEMVHRTPGGREIDLEVVAAITSFKGKRSLLVEWHDISERKAYEAELLQSRVEVERQRRIALERMNDTTHALTGWMWETDADGRFTFLTDSVKTVVGVSPEWHYGKTRADLRAEGSSDSYQPLDFIDECVAKREPFRGFDYRRFAPDGTTHWMRTSGVPFFDENGVFQGYRGAAFCIDYEKELEAARDELENQAAEARRRLEDAIEAQENGFALIDAENRLAACNSAFERLAELVGEKAAIGAPVAARLFDRAGDDALPDAPPSAATDAVVRNLPDGRWLQTQERPTADGGFVSIWTDVTELIQAREAAEDANVAKSDFLAMISHEIRTPLNAVLGMASVLLHGDLPDAQRQQVQTIQNSGTALLALINDVLDLSKIEAGKVELEHQPFRLFELLDTVLDIAGEKAETKNLRLTAYLDADVPNALIGDANRLRQILLNLVSNAVKFTDEGEVHIGASIRPPATPSDAPRLRIEVSDTGIGITEDALERLFSPFTQADASTTRRYGGTGLGLSISKRLIELLDGDIGVSSAPGEGSMFWIEAPFAFDHAAEPATNQPLSGRDVLLISPLSSPVREACRRVLNTRGASVHIANDIAAATRFLTSRTADAPLDAVILSSRFERWAVHAFCAAANVAARQIVIVGGREASELAAATKQPKVRATFARSWQLEEAISPRKTLPVSSDAPESTEARQANALNILLVEDNRVNQMVATAMLKLDGHRIDIAEDGLEAIDAVTAKAYDIVLMDMQMPRMDGLDAARRIRALGGRHAETPIIAMTANVLVEDRNRCIDAGMNDFLSKPISHGLLAQTIARWSPSGDPSDAAASSDAHVHPPPSRAMRASGRRAPDGR